MKSPRSIPSILFLITSIAAFGWALVMGCDGDGTGPAGNGVVASVTVTPGAYTFTALDDTHQLTASARDVTGQTITGRTFTWSSSNTSIANVNASGLVTAVDNGPAMIIATTGGVSDTAEVTVEQAVADVEVTPAMYTLMAIDDTFRFSAVATDANGNTVPEAVFQWSSAEEHVATVDAAGLTTARRPGGTQIWAEAGGVPEFSLLNVEVFATVSAGGTNTGRGTTCGVRTDGDAYCWGYNEFGQLGDGTTTDRHVPVLVAGGLSNATMSVGFLHTCSATTDGDAYCWGRNAEGELGDGTTTDRHVPALVDGGLSFAELSAGVIHTCGVTTGGEAYCWGANWNGQLGDGTTTDRHVPGLVIGGLSFATLSVGSYHTCGVTTGGGLYCWGRNPYGQLGDGTTVDRHAPVQVSGLTFASVNAGWSHTCGVTTGGNLYCWGSNVSGQLGDGTTTDRSTPVLVSIGFATVSAGINHTCGVTTGGETYCWGGNEYGQIGDGTTTDRHDPVVVSGALDFATLSAALSGHTCGVTTSWRTYCWGRNPYGQVGDGTTLERHEPVRVQSP